MIKLTQIGLLLALVILTAVPAKAALLIEPLVGFNLGTKVEIEDSTNYSGGSGLAYGGRLGYENFGFQLGLDYLNSSINMNEEDFNSNLEMSEWAAFVGFKFPILLRVYAGYIFSATGESNKYESGVQQGKLELEKGTGGKLGLGFTVLPFLDINLEFRQGTFTDNQYRGADIDAEVKYSSYMLGVSLPFTL